jgi:hypothetical protein
MRSFLPALLTGTLLALGGFGSASVPNALGASGLHLGSSQSAFDHTWTRDQMKCIGGICGYKAYYLKFLWNQVHYSHGKADQIAITFDPDHYNNNPPSPASNRYWSYLTNLLPAGAKRATCRTIQKTGGLSGPAFACLYSYQKKTILVDHYLTTAANLAIGDVNLNQDFSYIEAAH